MFKVHFLCNLLELKTEIIKYVITLDVDAKKYRETVINCTEKKNKVERVNEKCFSLLQFEHPE